MLIRTMRGTRAQNALAPAVGLHHNIFFSFFPLFSNQCYKDVASPFRTCGLPVFVRWVLFFYRKKKFTWTSYKVGVTVNRYKSQTNSSLKFQRGVSVINFIETWAIVERQHEHKNIFSLTRFHLLHMVQRSNERLFNTNTFMTHFFAFIMEETHTFLNPRTYKISATCFPNANNF